MVFCAAPVHKSILFFRICGQERRCESVADDDDDDDEMMEGLCVRNIEEASSHLLRLSAAEESRQAVYLLEPHSYIPRRSADTTKPIRKSDCVVYTYDKVTSI